MELMHAAEAQDLDVAGHTVGEIRVALTHVLNIGNQEARLDGRRVSDDVVMSDDDGTLEFVKLAGRKGVGQIWSADEYCQRFGISREQLNQQIEEGLKVMRLADGSLRITETAVDQFIAGDAIVVQVANALTRIANHFDPPPPDKVDSGYIAKKLGCSKVWAARMAAEGRIPRSCIVPGTGDGKLWKFYRSRIDQWIEER